MGLLRFISEQRERHVLDRARPHLVDGERVLGWVRARHPKTGRRGIFFITSHHALVAWSGARHGERVPWPEVVAWGIDRGARGGPVVSIESRERKRTLVQVVVETRDMARAAAGFMSRFAELAPDAARDGVVPEGGKRPPPDAEGDFRHIRRSPQQMAKRIALTVLGAGLIVVGLVVIPLPGPWSFVLNIAGLAVLAREYDWADDLLGWTKERFEAAKERMARRKRSSE